MQNKSLLILGRQPALGLAELASLYGADKLRPVGDQAALLNLDFGSIDFARLGGSIKLCRVMSEFGSTSLAELQKNLEPVVTQIASDAAEGKIRLGLSVYGLRATPQQITAAGLSFKKVIRQAGRSVRIVPNQESALNSAQVIHNQLTGAAGCELVMVRDGKNTIIARTIAEQDIESYTLRDRGRPKRDARVGMLPPKLAQIIVNLAGKHLPPGTEVDLNRPYNQNPSQARLLDPFCGTGVLLQEAILLGYAVQGTDIEPRMVDYSRINLDWANTTFRTKPAPYFLEQGDATNHHWQQPVDLVASETYLGQPFSVLPSPEKLEQVRGTCNAIIEKSLKNIGRQIKPGTRLCLAVPAWRIAPGKFQHLPLIDQLAQLGYNRMRFEHVRDDKLLYYREEQIVARELLVLTRK